MLLKKSDGRSVATHNEKNTPFDFFFFKNALGPAQLNPLWKKSKCNKFGTKSAHLEQLYKLRNQYFSTFFIQTLIAIWKKYV